MFNNFIHLILLCCKCHDLELYGIPAQISTRLQNVTDEKISQNKPRITTNFYIGLPQKSKFSVSDIYKTCSLLMPFLKRSLNFQSISLTTSWWTNIHHNHWPRFKKPFTDWQIVCCTLAETRAYRLKCISMIRQIWEWALVITMKLYVVVSAY